MPLNTEVDYNTVVIKGTVELGVKGERGLQGFKGDQGIQGPPVPVAHELGDDPDLAVSQKLLTDSIADMEQSNEAAVTEATHQAGLAGDSAVIATDQAGIASSSAGEAAQSAQSASGSSLAAGQYASTATEQAGIAAIKAGEASSSAVDAASQAGLAADSEASAEQAATIATTKADEASQSAQSAAQSATQAEETLDDKVDKVAGKQLSDENYTLDEKNKLAGVAAEATKNRDDSENADKLHDHVISDVTGLSAALQTKFDKTDVVQDTGQSTEKVMSQKAVTDLVGVIYARLGNVEYELFIRTLFMRGEKGFWADPSDTSTLFQNSDGTIAVTANGDPIGLVLDKTGNNYDLKQTVSASRPKLLNGGIVFDMVDDALTLTVPAGGITGTLFLATTRGTASYGVSMPAGVWTLGNDYNPLGEVVSAVLVDRVLTVDEKARLHVFGIGKGGTEFGVETTFYNAFRNWKHLVDFPLIDTSNAYNLAYAWYGCSGLTSFPVIYVSSSTSFYASWFGCKNLVTFPANFFDNCLATSFSSAFSTTNLSQESIDGILVSINSNNTANGTFLQSGGSAPSIVGQAAIDAMRSRGWTVTTTGGY